MARPLPSLTAYNLPFSSMPITSFFTLIAVFSIFSIITFLCGSNRSKKLESEMEEETASDGCKEKKLLSKLNSNISSRALSMVRLISGKKVEAEEEEEEDLQDEDEALWRKTILMGERCRPLDFSGNIVYDSHGNMLPELSHQDEYH